MCYHLHSRSMIYNISLTFIIPSYTCVLNIFAHQNFTKALRFIEGKFSCFSFHSNTVLKLKKKIIQKANNKPVCISMLWWKESKSNHGKLLRYRLFHRSYLPALWVLVHRDEQINSVLKPTQGVPTLTVWKFKTSKEMWR